MKPRVFDAFGYFFFIALLKKITFFILIRSICIKLSKITVKLGVY